MSSNGGVKPETGVSLSPTLEIRNLCVSMSRGGQHHMILNGLDFRALPGEITALVGRSGSGKSTLAHVVQGLLPDASKPMVAGSIRINKNEIVGADNALLKFARQQLVRVVSQDPLDALNPTMTVARQMAETCKRRQAIDRLRWAGITDVHRVLRSFPHEISGGERQRVLIAMATGTPVPLIIADEPTTGLDPENKIRVIELLRALAAEGVAVVMITHDLGIAETANRIAIMDRGRIIEFGPTSGILSNPTNPYTSDLLAIQYKSDATRWKTPPTLSVSNGEAINSSALPVVERNVPWLYPSDPHQNSLEMRQVSKAFHRRDLFRSETVRVLNSIDMVVRSGECVALIGESGVGKSTFLKIAAGVLRQDSGTVAWQRNNVPQLVFQDPKSFLTPWIPIGEQIVERLISQNIDGSTRSCRLMELLDFVELDPLLSHALPSELSVGQCQRAVIARALAVPPRLLLCDEPISALDTSLAASILNLLGRIRRSYGTAIVLATHDLAAARIAADRVYALRNGNLHHVSEMIEYSTSTHRATLRC